MSQLSTIVDRYSSIDELLGSASTRYFGEGYTNVDYQVSGLAVDPTRALLRARTRVSYPPTWSKKNAEMPRTPHLSTIDALVLNAYAIDVLCTLLLTSTYSNTRLLLRKIVIKASPEPDEDLDDLPLEGRFIDTVMLSGEFFKTLTTASVRIGRLTVDTHIEHDYRQRHAQASNDIEGLLTTDRLDLYRHYKRDCTQNHRHRLNNVIVDREGLLAEAEASSDLKSLDSAVFTPVQGIILLAQLTQVVLYRLENITRNDSDTLWMRSILYEAIHEPAITSQVRARVRLVSRKTIRMGAKTSGVYRLVGQVHGTRYVLNVAQRLPNFAPINESNSPPQSEQDGG